MLGCFSCVQVFVTLWTAACQDPLSIGLPRHEHGRGVAMPSSRGISGPRDQTHFSCIGRQILYHWPHLGHMREWQSVKFPYIWKVVVVVMVVVQSLSHV